MKLPYTPSSLVLWLDPAEKFVQRDSNNKVLSVLNRVNGNPIIQTTAAAQPTWSATSFNGTPGLTFNGSQGLTANDIGLLMSGNKKQITIVQAIYQPIPALGIGVSFGTSLNATLNYYFTDFSPFGTTSGISFNMGRFDDSHSSVFARIDSTSISNVPFVYTATYTSTSVSLRINGVDIQTTPDTDGQLTVNNCTIGSVINSAGISSGLTGVIGPTLIFLGSNGVISAEKAVMRAVGL